jgi:hypothetical protein
MRGRARFATTAGVLVAAALLVPNTAVGAASPAAVAPPCKTFAGTAVLSPGLPKVGAVTRVKPKISINGASLSGCQGQVSSGRVSATVEFGKSTNCMLFITQVTANVVVKAKGTLRIVWNNKKTSTIALSMSFGSVPDKASLATMVGTVNAGLFKGRTESWTVLWSMKEDECFGGAPLTSLAFSQFAEIATN